LKRDKTLDYLRGLAVFQVVFVHVIYWLDVIRPEFLTVVKSFTLFEMSIFFFVTGAVNSIKEYPSYGSFCAKRIKALLVPYYVYALICIAISIIYYIAVGEFSAILLIKLLISWLIPVNTQIMPLWYFTWAMWFVPVYLISIVIFPAVRKAVQRYGRLSIAVLVLILITIEIILTLALSGVSEEGAGIYIHSLSLIIAESSFLTIFMGTGVLYSQLKERRKKDLILSASVLAASATGLAISAFLPGSTLDMQKNQFPANHVFLFFSFAIMTSLYLAMPFIKKVYRSLIKVIPAADKLFTVFSDNSMYVFLYQSFAFWFTDLILLILKLNYTVFEPFAAFILAYALVWFTIKMIGMIKSAGKRLLKNKT